MTKKTSKQKIIHKLKNMDVSKNRGTPKSCILIGFSIINHPFWGVSPYFWKLPYFIATNFNQKCRCLLCSTKAPSMWFGHPRCLETSVIAPEMAIGTGDLSAEKGRNSVGIRKWHVTFQCEDVVRNFIVRVKCYTLGPAKINLTVDSEG